MKKIVIMFFTLMFGVGTIQSYGQETKQKEEKSKKEVSLSPDEKRASKKVAKEAKKQKKDANKGNAYGKAKEAEGKEFGKARSEASKGKSK